MSDSDMAHERALHFYSMGRFQQALDALEGSPPLDSDFLWYVRASSLHQTDRDEEALSVATRGLAEFSESPLLLLLTGHLHRGLGDHAAAERALLRGLQIDPEDVDLISAYARVVAAAGQLTKAERLLERAAQIDPEAESMWGARLMVRHLAGDDVGMRQTAREILQRDPENATARAMLAVDDMEGGRPDVARGHLGTLAQNDIELVEQYEDAFDQVRYLNHPAMAPVVLLDRVGPMRAWAAVAITIAVLAVADLTLIGGVIGLGWMALALYSWVVPPLVRRLLIRNRGSNV